LGDVGKGLRFLAANHLDCPSHSSSVHHHKLLEFLIGKKLPEFCYEEAATAGR
jgi:hypothetical protein